MQRNCFEIIRAVHMKVHEVSHSLSAGLLGQNKCWTVHDPLLVQFYINYAISRSLKSISQFIKAMHEYFSLNHLKYLIFCWQSHIEFLLVPKGFKSQTTMTTWVPQGCRLLFIIHINIYCTPQTFKHIEVNPIQSGEAISLRFHPFLLIHTLTVPINSLHFVEFFLRESSVSLSF